MPETKPTMATETPDEEFFVDPFPPRDPNIPFFWRPGVYTKYLSTRPRLDVDRFPELKFARLVQPGIHSVEVYEAIIRKTLGYHRTLKVFVTQAGIVQTIRLYGARARAYIPQDKRLSVQDQDISFTLVTGEEQVAILKWLEARNYWSFPSKRVTPVGRLVTVAAHDGTKRKEWYDKILLELGLQETSFPRSLLPPGVPPFSLTYEEGLKTEPGIDCPNLHGDASERRRIEWLGLKN
jgi:hypothetical protein